jgi:Flp pilus assembly pilin Flp
MVEYALILVLMALACLLMLNLFGQQLILLWQSVIDNMKNPGHIL